MSDVWSFDAGTDTFTLTLDGSGSAQESRSRTFSGLTPSTLHTVYLDVNPDVTGVGAFLQVVGGDTTEAASTGAQTLTARGDTDASGTLTVRFGVLDAGSAPDTAGGDDLQYADRAAIVAGGWTIYQHQTPTGGDVDVGGPALGPDPASLELTTASYARFAAGSTGYIGMYRSFAVTPGLATTLTCWMGSGSVNAWWTTCNIDVFDGTVAADDTIAASAIGHAALNGTEADTNKVASFTPSGATVTVRIQANTSDSHAALQTWYLAELAIAGAGGGAATVDFSGLTYCEGSGQSTTGDNTGLGDEGDDPIPSPPPGGYPPPASGGARPFQMSNIPAAGLGYWNSTVKTITPLILPNLLTTAATNSTHLLLRFGPASGYLDSAGNFSFSKWADLVAAVAEDTRANTALEAGIGDTAWAWYFDEPFHPTRYGSPLSFATVERMCQTIKSYWPTWRTIIRVAPTDDRWIRAMSGCDTMWAEYKLNQGDVVAYKARQLQAAADLGVNLIFGLHVKDWDRVGTGRLITPSELRHYGGILADTSVTVAMGGWTYEDALVAQAGWWDALKYVRDLFASRDP